MWMKISSTSFTGASNAIFDNVFSSTYSHYLIYPKVIGTTTSAYLYAKLRVGGVDTSTNYRRRQAAVNNTSLSTALSTSDTQILNLLRFSNTDATDDYPMGLIYLSWPAHAVTTSGMNYLSENFSSTTGNFTGIIQAFAQSDTTVFDGINFYPSLGTITGTITIYGLRES